MTDRSFPPRDSSATPTGKEVYRPIGSRCAGVISSVYQREGYQREGCLLYGFEVRLSESGEDVVQTVIVRYYWL